MNIRIPADWEPHRFCLLSWAVHQEWGDARAAVKRELAAVTRTIARYEPVILLAPPGRGAREAAAEFAGVPNVTVLEAPVDDIWMRDIAPTFAQAGREIVAIDWGFNAWGGVRSPRSGDRLVAALASLLGVRRIPAGFVAEGGAFAVDGLGTLITTKSCLLDPARNPSRRGGDLQGAIETSLRRLGIRKVLWLEGDRKEPITRGHVDGYVLPAPGGIVLVEAVHDGPGQVPEHRAQDLAHLENAVTADDCRMHLVRVFPPRLDHLKGASKSFAACYLNAYVAGRAVITAAFGDEDRDEAARTALAAAFPGREVVMLRIDAIADGGGGIHCLTQPFPLTKGVAR